MVSEVEDLRSRLPGGAVINATKLGLSLTPSLAADCRGLLLGQVAAMARQSSGCRQTLTAWLGDILVASGRIPRGQLAAYATAAGLERGTLSNAKLVCARIPLSCRHDALSWTHHCEVGLLLSDPAEIRRWLTTAADERLTVADLRLRLRSHCAARARHCNSGPTVAGFRLMRDLRAAARTVVRHEAVWMQWTPLAARQALDELEPLGNLIAHLHLRTKPAVTRADLREPQRIGLD